MELSLPLCRLGRRLDALVLESLLTTSNTLLAYAIWIPTHSYGLLIFFALVIGATSGIYWGVRANVHVFSTQANLSIDYCAVDGRGGRIERAPICVEPDVVDCFNACSV